MIDPTTQYIVYKQRENELMRQIERKLAARDQGSLVETHQPWNVKTVQQMIEKAFSRLLSVRRHSVAKNSSQA